LVERHRERDRRRPEQEVHELRAGKVGGVGGPGQQQEQTDDPQRMQHRIGERMPPCLQRHRIGRRIGQQRHRQPEQRRLGEINPERERIAAHGSSSRENRLLAATKVATVASSVTMTDSARITRIAMPCSASRSSFCTTPTPAGMKSSDRLASMPRLALSTPSLPSGPRASAG
ncbi:hypothetical protein chiPu_0032016, partial [Chiloscyllium punctatum]|nr:hypothetical protein [Chiloscyllium punctatum]